MSNGAALVFSTQAFDGTFVGTLSGAGSLTKAGIGIVTLTGDHPMTGSATVQQGGLAPNGTFGGSVDVKPGAAFTAAGAVGGSLTSWARGRRGREPGRVAVRDVGPGGRRAAGAVESTRGHR